MMSLETEWKLHDTFCIIEQLERRLMRVTIAMSFAQHSPVYDECNKLQQEKEELRKKIADKRSEYRKIESVACRETFYARHKERRSYY